MHLYTFDAAPNPKRLYYFLKFKEIEIKTTQVDLVKKENLKDPYLKVNQFGTVPALVLEDGTVMTEVIGICSYLEALYTEKPLLGRSSLEKAEILSWDHYIFNNLLLPTAEIFRNSHPAFKNRALPGPKPVPQIPELIERGENKLFETWKIIEARLSSKDFIASKNFSLADIDLFVCIDFLVWALNRSTPKELTAVQNWLERIKTII